VPNFLFTLAEGAAGEGHSINLFPDPVTIIWTVINFAILLAVLYKFLYKPLLGALNARDEQIEGALKKAAADRAEAERLRAELEAKLADAQREAQNIISTANKTAAAAREQIETEARNRAAEMLENATKTIEREKVKALAELREEVANLAIMVAGKVIDKNLDNAEQRRLAESFVAEVGKN